MKNKGITLVALVVTIVIMLILAGVTLNLTMGDNGIFTKTKDIAKKYEDASKQEENDLNHLSGILKNHIGITPSEPIETYTITYNLNRKNDEKTVTQTKKFGIDIEILGTEETKENYEFLGWASSIEKLDEGIVEYKKGDKYSENEDLTLYAIWAKNILTAEDIGKQVKYDIDLDGIKENYDWKIFYQGKTEDGEANGRIFIIASDFVPSNIQELITATDSSHANIAAVNKLGRKWSSLPSTPSNNEKK